MLHQGPDTERVIAAVSRRDLEPRDISVLVVLMTYMDRSGKVRMTCAAIAEKLGMKSSMCIASMTRLKQQGFVVRVQDKSTGDRYYLVNPFVSSVGGPQRRGHLWAQFKAALED